MTTTSEPAFHSLNYMLGCAKAFSVHMKEYFLDAPAATKRATVKQSL
jgi:hypothetical protein